jgi:Lon protease-like protein
MILPNATLFPRALLPLYIFEPRYRRMLADALQSTRMFAVAMRKPGSPRETPMPVAGLGIIRVARSYKDGTSELLLQGLTRVALEKVVRYQPYRTYRIHPLSTPPCDSVAADALLARVRELIVERFSLGPPFPFASGTNTGGWDHLPPPVSAKDVVGYLNSIGNPEQAADLVSCTVLPGAAERQAILETVDVETRLRRLIQFLITEIHSRRKGHA